MLLVLRQDRRAVIAVIAAIVSIPMIGCAALLIDCGMAGWVREHLQSSADAAALAAAVDVSRASAIASTALQDNGFETRNLSAAMAGSYCPDPALPPGQRFVLGSAAPTGCSVPTGPLPNAVQVTAAATAPIGFGRAISNLTGLNIGASSVATRIDLGGIRAGSRLASLDAGLLNGILGPLLGTNISLSLMSYTGLLASNINALDFLNALAIQLHLDAGNYGGLANASASVGQIIAAEITALSKSGSTATVNAAIAGLQAIQATVPGVTFNLAKLVNLNAWAADQINAVSPAALNASLNALDLLNATAQIANGSAALASTIGLTLPGIASAGVTASIIEPPQSGYFVFGPVGMDVHTAQTRLQVKVSVLNGTPLLGQIANLSLPLYLELADGDAQLTGIACGTDQASNTIVQIAAQTGVADIWIGNIGLNAMTNVSRPITGTDITPATILSLAGLVQVTAKGHVQIGTSGRKMLTFDQSDFANGTVRTISSSQLVGSALASLLQNTTLTVNALGVGIPLGGVLSVVGSVLSALPLDSLLDPLLRALGVSLGSLDVSVTGARCRMPVLVH